jgi:hypothetical protein
VRGERGRGVGVRYGQYVRERVRGEYRVMKLMKQKRGGKAVFYFPIRIFFTFMMGKKGKKRY